MEGLTIRWHNAMAEIPQTAWDRLAEPLETPLLEWTWLHELEASGSIAPANGWHPRHLTAWRTDRLVGGAPLYIKQHSQGEFVFDQWWARWAAQAGIAYYPKMVGMSPATPAVGYRFLVDAGPAGGAEVQQAMLQAIDAYCTARGISGLHLLFVDPQWHATLNGRDFLAWHHQSFLWQNQGCRVFEDYLRPFKSIQRRNIKRERSRVRQAGLVFQALSGDRIDPAWADTMFDYYLNTNAQYGPWAARYLNEDFFRGIFRRYRHRLLLVAASRSDVDQPVALSLLMHKGSQLIGRYWGSVETIKDLHFSMCFYEPIQWAIDHGIHSFDPGAGSAHKLYRGFQAVANTSLHRFYEPNLQLLFQRFIGNINDVELANIAAMNARLPFSQSLHPAV